MEKRLHSTALGSSEMNNISDYFQGESTLHSSSFENKNKMLDHPEAHRGKKDKDKINKLNSYEKEMKGNKEDIAKQGSVTFTAKPPQSQSFIKNYEAKKKVDDETVTHTPTLTLQLNLTFPPRKIKNSEKTEFDKNLEALFSGETHLIQECICAPQKGSNVLNCECKPIKTQSAYGNKTDNKEKDPLYGTIEEPPVFFDYNNMQQPNGLGNPRCKETCFPCEHIFNVDAESYFKETSECPRPTVKRNEFMYSQKCPKNPLANDPRNHYYSNPSPSQIHNINDNYAAYGNYTTYSGLGFEHKQNIGPHHYSTHAPPNYPINTDQSFGYAPNNIQDECSNLGYLTDGQRVTYQDQASLGAAPDEIQFSPELEKRYYYTA